MLRIAAISMFVFSSLASAQTKVPGVVIPDGNWAKRRMEEIAAEKQPLLNKRAALEQEWRYTNHQFQQQRRTVGEASPGYQQLVVTQQAVLDQLSNMIKQLDNEINNIGANFDPFY